MGEVVQRPWGTYEILAKGFQYQVKRLMILPGERLSKQYHRHREEHWVVVSGYPVITIGDEVEPSLKGCHYDIGKEEIHRISNEMEEPAVIIEVQFGEFLSEDDIIRVDDAYGRC